jgi:sec-independent protein translocase protein TatB
LSWWFAQSVKLRHDGRVFDVNGGEMLMLAGIALVVLGPDKLPGYAAQAARLLRQVRTMADNAKDHAREQLGPEFDDIDWKSLDPRQYDPRRVIRDAMLGQDEAGATDHGAAAPSPTSARPPADGPGQRRGTPGVGSEYDADAT